MSGDKQSKKSVFDEPKLTGDALNKAIIKLFEACATIPIDPENKDLADIMRVRNRWQTKPDEAPTPKR